MPSQDEDTQIYSIERLIALFDKNINLEKAMKKLQADFDLLSAFAALTRPKDKVFKRKHKKMVGLSLGVSQTTLEGQLKRLRKKLTNLKAKLLREYRQLQQEAAEASERPAVQQPQTAEEDSTTENEPTVVGEDQAPTIEASRQRRRQKNILQAVHCVQVPDDGVMVEMEGRQITQRELALWYQKTDMDQHSRKVFEAKNVEINQTRRIRRS